MNGLQFSFLTNNFQAVEKFKRKTPVYQIKDVILTGEMSVFIRR